MQKHRATAKAECARNTSVLSLPDAAEAPLHLFLHLLAGAGVPKQKVGDLTRQGWIAQQLCGNSISSSGACGTQ